MRVCKRLWLPALLWPVLGTVACGSSSAAENGGRDASSDEPSGDGDGNDHGDGDNDGDGSGLDAGSPGGPDGSGDGDGAGDGDGDGLPDMPGPDASAGSEFDQASFTLCKLVNDYREQNGLARVAISPALMTVAQAHVRDLAAHADLCNMHSWSEGSDLWSGCCFDFSDGTCMWKKPGELTSAWGAERYPGNGYEDATSATTPESALDSWKGSKPHNDVILNLDIWTNYNPWPAMGCAVGEHHSVLWFGDAADPRGSLGD